MTTQSFQVGYLPGDRAQLVELVHGISHKEGRNIDATREQTSVGAKKQEPTRISPVHQGFRPLDAFAHLE